MKKSQKILFCVLCVFALAAILGITWMTASHVTSAQIYGELQAMPTRRPAQWSQQRATAGATI